MRRLRLAPSQAEVDGRRLFGAPGQQCVEVCMAPTNGRRRKLLSKAAEARERQKAQRQKAREKAKTAKHAGGGGGHHHGGSRRVRGGWGWR